MPYLTKIERLARLARARRLVSMRDGGMSWREIAATSGISPARASQIVSWGRRASDDYVESGPQRHRR